MEELVEVPLIGVDYMAEDTAEIGGSVMAKVSHPTSPTTNRYRGRSSSIKNTTTEVG